MRTSTVLGILLVVGLLAWAGSSVVAQAPAQGGGASDTVVGQHRGFTNKKLYLKLDDGTELTLIVDILGDKDEKWHKDFEVLSRDRHLSQERRCRTGGDVHQKSGQVSVARLPNNALQLRRFDSHDGPGEPNAISNVIGYDKFYSRSHDAVIHVYDERGSVIETHEHKGEFKGANVVFTDV